VTRGFDGGERKRLTAAALSWGNELGRQEGDVRLVTFTFSPRNKTAEEEEKRRSKKRPRQGHFYSADLNAEEAGRKN